MSDLTNLFANHKQTHPSKRLFPTKDYAPPRQRSIEPHKSTQKPVSIKTILSHSQLPKRTLSKNHLKKQLKFYNNQILLCLVRKVFFSIVAILLFNFTATDFSRPILYSNIVFAITQFNMHFDYQIFSSTYFRVLVSCLQVGVFGLNFFYLLAYISNNLMVSALLFVSVNAAMNYLILMLLWPVVQIRGVKNMRTPYLGLLQKTLSQIHSYLESVRSYFNLSKPVFCLNLFYWLAVICYIIHTQQQTLFSNIFTLQMLKAATATTAFMHLLTQLVSNIDSKIGIQLLSANKKEINVNLLRLSDQDSGRIIHWQIEKYIWSSCQAFWDTDFLTHHYHINYDLLQDYMTRQIQKLDNQIKCCLTQFKYQHPQSPQQQYNTSKLKLEDILQYISLLRLIFQLQHKLYLFYIADQIALFEAMGTTAPVSMQKIHRAINRVVVSLQLLQQSVSIRQLRVSLFQLSCFLSKAIEREDD